MQTTALAGSRPPSTRGSDEPAASVAIERLTKSFGKVEVIADLTVSFRAGAISVLLGSSGCGKTTILRCIAGLEEPSAGDIRIHERTVFSSSQRINVPPERRDLGMVFQSYAIWPHMTVYENIALPLRAHGVRSSEAQARVADLLKLVGLDGLAERSATQLSGGQQQRVAIARALVTNPSVILADEPTGNLDTATSIEVMQLLQDLREKRKITVILITHEPDIAAYGTRIIAVRDGAIVSDVRNTPRYMVDDAKPPPRTLSVVGAHGG